MANTDGNRPAPKTRRNFERTRWLYQKAGRDLGPYTPSEIYDLMRKGDVTGDTPLRESTGQQWLPLSKLPDFQKLLMQLQMEKEQRAREHALDAVEDAVRSKRKAPYMIIAGLTLCLTIAGSIYGWNQYKAINAGSASGYATSLFKDLALDKVPVRAYLDTRGKIQWPSEHVPSRKGKKQRTKRQGSGSARLRGVPNAVPTADDLKPAGGGGVTEVAFDKGSVGRELSSADINRVRSGIVPKLLQCARREAQRRTAFLGTTVSVTIKPSGTVGNVRVGTNGRRSKSFVGCARRAVRGMRVAPFDGVGRTITIPLKVGR